MSFGLYAAVAGSMVQEKNMEILTNNLANVGTTGFKEDRAIFKELYPKVVNAAELTDEDSQQRFIVEKKMNMGYLSFAGVKTDFSNGEIKYTGNPLDVAISGSGFFVVTTPQGEEFYTRMGSFSLNEKGELVTHEGYPLQGKAKTIMINGKDIVIDRDGAITVDGVPIDALKVVDFKDYSALKKVGDNLFENSERGNERGAKECEIHHHCVELSNINIVKEMVKMINVLRLYESYQKVIQSFDETTGKATREVGVVA